MYTPTRMVCLSAALTGMLATAAPAGAQTLEWDDRFFLNVSGGIQAGSQDFEQTLTFPLYDEQASVRAPHEIDNGILFDIGAGARVRGNFAVGVGVSRFSNSNDLAVLARLPHPVFDNSPRDATASAAEVPHSELGVHLQALYMVPLGARIELALSGGPSIFSIRHDLVSGVTVQEGPSFTPTITSVQVVERSETAMGFNVGADWMYAFRQASTTSAAPGVGLGVSARYARASTDVEDGAGGSVDVKAGGFQLGFGLRLRWR